MARYSATMKEALLFSLNLAKEMILEQNSKDQYELETFDDLFTLDEFMEANRIVADKLEGMILKLV
jgi:hypothetical protein